jgi:hypothetical protein
VVELAVVGEDGVGLFSEFFRGGGGFGRGRRAELGAGLEGEWFDPVPVRGEEAWGDGGSVGFGEGDGLPAVGVDDAVGGVDGLVESEVAVGLAIGAGF